MADGNYFHHLALPTVYRGYRFRSRLEARWAVFFDEMGISFDYELQGFSLPSGLYLPDFYLTCVRMWAEVKPEELNVAERNKCRDLARISDRQVLQLVGPPSFREYTACRYWAEVGIREDIPYSLDVGMFERQFRRDGRLFAQPEYLAGDESQFSPLYRSSIYCSRAAMFTEVA